MELKVEAEQLESGACVLSIAGEIDMYTAPELERQLLGAARNGTSSIIVDLTDCGFIDSTGLRVLVEANRHPDVSGRLLVLVSDDRNIRRVFEITGLDRVFPIYASRATAVAATVHQSADPKPAMLGPA